MDGESATWVARLRAPAEGREEAVRDLHALLLKAARFELARRAAMLPAASAREREDLAQQSADDALMAVLGKLEDYRGESRFTTWAYKFALLEAAVKTRGRAWQGREVQLDDTSWATLAAHGETPHRQAETRAVIAAVQEAVRGELSAHQRRVLVAIVLNDVPIDVLAERLETTRGALYKTLHDARRKLRDALARREIDIDVYLGRG
jgi:RNA polymerase sigma-70 factor, ECF subfamily